MKNACSWGTAQRSLDDQVRCKLAPDKKADKSSGRAGCRQGKVNIVNLRTLNDTKPV